MRILLYVTLAFVAAGVEQFSVGQGGLISHRTKRAAGAVRRVSQSQVGDLGQQATFSGTVRDGILLLLDMSDQKDIKKFDDLMTEMLWTCTWISRRLAEGSLAMHVLYNDQKRHEELLSSFSSKWPHVTFVDMDPIGIWEAPEEWRNTKRNFGKYPLGYRQMCDLWATKIPNYTRSVGWEYFMRFDADSMVTCPAEGAHSLLQQEEQVNSKVISMANIDVFQTMRQGNYVYGYYQVTRDRDFVSRGFNEFMKTYLFENHLDIRGTNAARKQVLLEKDDDGALSFYNNFEVVQVSYLNRPEVVRFTEAVSASSGIYDKRWGDAIIRFYQVTLFTNASQVRCFGHDFFTYTHQQGDNKGCDLHGHAGRGGF
jgi:hypothetical protein